MRSLNQRAFALSFGLTIASVCTLNARIGETTLQFVARYGPPKDTAVSKINDKNFSLIEGAIHHTYEYQGWKIRAAFLQLNAPAVRMDYQKILTAGVDPVIKDYELQAIMAANTPPGTTWKQVLYDNPNSPNTGGAKAVEGMIAGAAGQKMWQRSDGAILSLRSNLIVRVELPIAREYEAKLKVDKEQKARASVPQF